MHHYDDTSESANPMSNLAYLTLESNINYNDLPKWKVTPSLTLYGDYPNLEEVKIKNVGLFTSDFTADKLTRVNVELSNGYLSEIMYYYNSTEAKLPEGFIYLMGVPDSNINITHTLEDLYGTWTYRDSSGNEVFTVTFQENGYVRINDGLGIIGVDLFTFSEIDNSTLLLKAETEDFWGELISFNMPYELYGKELHLSIYGHELDLVNENWDPFE